MTLGNQDRTPMLQQRPQFFQPRSDARPAELNGSITTDVSPT